LRRKGASLALEAANPAYETRIFGPDQVQVQGKLVGLIRRTCKAHFLVLTRSIRKQVPNLGDAL